MFKVFLGGRFKTEVKLKLTDVYHCAVITEIEYYLNSWPYDTWWTKVGSTRTKSITTNFYLVSNAINLVVRFDSIFILMICSIRSIERLAGGRMAVYIKKFEILQKETANSTMLSDCVPVIMDLITCDLNVDKELRQSLLHNLVQSQ